MSQFDKLMALHFQDAINRRMPKRKPNRAAASNTTVVPEPDNSKSRSELREDDEHQPEPSYDDEKRVLQVEFTGLLEAVQETETKMVEMSALNHLMSTHVLQQAQQIGHLYEQAMEAMKNVELGNKGLSQAIQWNSSSRIFLLLLLVKS
ncbi:hypothetical protein RJ641_030239 [Dillenia turbinata]|uniref:Uncharacterized protein n=1 Tax=Dillenia turbinata TaxID=194707 RepID=A0AAN8W691_9MAGN